LRGFSEGQALLSHMPGTWLLKRLVAKKVIGIPLSNVKRFRGGLVFKAHRLVYHSTLGWRVIKKKKT